MGCVLRSTGWPSTANPATRQRSTLTRLTAVGALESSGPMRPGELAGRLGISAASMSRLPEALEEGRWVGRRHDPDDRRAYLLSLTDHGARTLAELRREGNNWLTAESST